MDRSVATLRLVEVRVGDRLIGRWPESLATYEHIGEAVDAWMDAFPEDELNPVTITRVTETRP